MEPRILPVPTTEQVENFIRCARLEIGPGEDDPYNLWCAAALRDALRCRRSFIADEAGKITGTVIPSEGSKDPWPFRPWTS